MDGTEDDMLFQESDEDEDPFEGFSTGEVDAAQQYQDNVQANECDTVPDRPIVCLESTEYSEPSNDEASDYDYEDDPASPGQ